MESCEYCTDEHFSIRYSFAYATSRVNPFNSEASFVQCTKKQKIMKIVLNQSCWYSLDSSRIVLSDEYPFARVSVISKGFSHQFCIGQISHQEHKSQQFWDLSIDDVRARFPCTCRDPATFTSWPTSPIATTSAYALR